MLIINLNLIEKVIIKYYLMTLILIKTMKTNYIYINLSNLYLHIYFLFVFRNLIMVI